MTKLSDEQILDALRAGGQRVSYVVAARLQMAGHRGIDTAFTLRRLKALEKAGKVRRVPSVYAVMICWEAVNLPALAVQPERETP